MKEKVGPPAFCSRSFRKVSSRSQRSRISTSSAGWSGTVRSFWKTGSPIGKRSVESDVLSLGGSGTGPPARKTKGTLNGNRSHRRDVRERGAPVRRAGARRLLGGMVWPLPRCRSSARTDCRGEEPEARQGQHRREPGPGGALRDPVDPEHDPLRGRSPEGKCRRRHAQGDARALPRPRRVRIQGRGPSGPLPDSSLRTRRVPGSSEKPHAWRGNPRSRRRLLRPSPRARSRRGRPRCDGGRVRSCRNDRHGPGRWPWAVRLNLMDMRTHSFLVINPRSGQGPRQAGKLVAAARKLGIEPHLLAEGEDPGETARASGAEILGMAGGDGSLAPVAQVALDTGARFVCVPLGTRNHFARDLGLDRNDPLAALGAFTGGTERRIDVGRVADRLFVNNVSFGVYAGLVH